MKYLSNALSLGMLDCLALGAVQLHCKQLDLQSAIQWTHDNPFISIVGHADTAILLSSILSMHVEMRRVSTVLEPDDVMLVAQYNGPRLLEGAVSLPEGAKIRWILVTVIQPCTICNGTGFIPGEYGGEEICSCSNDRDMNPREDLFGLDHIIYSPSVKYKKEE